MGDKHKKRERCEATGRVMFESHWAAMQTGDKYPESKYYAEKCLLCQHWHLVEGK